jgi:trimeric autotransporter adhesin
MAQALTSVCRSRLFSLRRLLISSARKGRRGENRKGAVDSTRWAAVRAALGLLILHCVCWPAAATTHYLYDELGRVVLATSPEQGSIVYEYDANGNRTAIHQWPPTALRVNNFLPSTGHAGQAITVYGDNFDTTPAANTLTIGGVVASVTTATPNTLSSTIPYGAATGPISVTVDGVTATSAQSLIIKLPTITSFAPVVVNPGMAVTAAGTHLNLVPGSTSMAVEGTPVTITSLSNIQATFTAPSNSGGPIAVTTSYGQGTSASNLVVVPSSINATNVVDHAAIELDGSSASLSINAQNKFAVLTFDAVAGQYLSIQIASITSTPSSGTVAYQVFSPSGTSFASGTIAVASARTIHLPLITTSGRYVVSFASGTKTSLQIAATVELDKWLGTGGVSLAIATAAPGQNKRILANLTAGDDVGLALTGLVLTPSSPNRVVVDVQRPTGQSLVNGGQYCETSTTPGCSYSLRNVPNTGTYQVLVEMQGLQNAGYSFTLSQDVTGTLTAGTPLSVNLDVPGRQGWLSFTTAATQTMALGLSSVATTPSGKSVSMVVYNASGTQVANTSGTATATLNLTNLAAGTYNVLLQPSNTALATMNVTLVNALGGSLPTDGTSQSFSTAVPGQNGYFTFTANAGDDLGLAVTGLTLAPTSPQNVVVNVKRPNGQSVFGGGGQFCSRTTTPGCTYSLRNLPDTGTYQVLVEMQGLQSASYTLTLSQNVTGTLTPGSPLNLTLDVPGRQGWLSFTTTATQTMALGLSSVATTPSSKIVSMFVYNASGSEIASGGGSSTSTLNLTNLAAGTYDVLLRPTSAETATMSMKLANGLVGSLPTDGTSQSISTGVPGQNGYFTFTANAGDDLGLAVTGLTLTPSSPQNVVVRVLRPNGQSALAGGGQFCNRTTTPGCSYALRNVPDTGTYQVLVEMQGLQDASYSLTLSHDVTGTLTPGSPLNLNLDVPGRQGWLTFTTTVVQTVTLNVTSIATTPSGRSVSMLVYNASGTQVGSTSGTSTATLNLTNLAVGTYNVLLQPSNTALATMSVQIP